MTKQFIQPSRYNGYGGKNRFAAKLSQRITGKNFLSSAYMADILNLANCASPDSIFNVGVPPCDLAKKKIKGVIFADKGVSFSGSDIASAAAFIDAVKTKTTAARGSRVYPVWDIINFEDNTGDPATGSIGNLSTATIVTQDAVPTFSFGYNGTEARHKTMALMSGASLDVFFVDEAYTVYGTLDSEGVFGGFSIHQAYADTTKFVVSDAVNQYRFRITLGSITEYRENSRYVVTNSGILAAVGLINIYLKVATSASNVHEIETIAEGGTNLFDFYPTILDDTTSWTAKRLDTGAAITVTSAAQDVPNKRFEVTLDSTTWTALPSGTKVQINLAAAATLATAGVKPYEGVAVVVTKP